MKFITQAAAEDERNSTMITVKKIEWTEHPRMTDGRIGVFRIVIRHHKTTPKWAVEGGPYPLGRGVSNDMEEAKNHALGFLRDLLLTYYRMAVPG